MELGERALAARELTSLHRETEDLRALTQCQEHRLVQCQREAQQSLAELASLESILALLHLREVWRIGDTYTHVRRHVQSLTFRHIFICTNTHSQLGGDREILV